MAVHHTAQIPRLIKMTFWNYMNTKITAGGMSTGTNAVTVYDAFPSFTDNDAAVRPSLIISHFGWEKTPFELGGGKFIDYLCIVSILAQNKNQREDIAYIIEGWLTDNQTDLIDYNVSDSTDIGTIYFRDVSVSAPFTPIIGNLPEEYEYLLEVPVTLRVFLD